MSADTRKIITSYVWPICFGPHWQALFDGEEELGQYGTGPTEQAAIDDLLALHDVEQSPIGAA